MQACRFSFFKFAHNKKFQVTPTAHLNWALCALVHSSSLAGRSAEMKMVLWVLAKKILISFLVPCQFQQYAVFQLMVFLAKQFRVFSFVQRQIRNCASSFAVDFSFIVYLGFFVRHGFQSSAKNRDNIVVCKLAGSASSSLRTTRNFR